MKGVGTKAKKTAIAVSKVPQHIGRGILSVPQTISKLAKNKNKAAGNNKLEHADKLEFISKEILEGQGNRRMVRESVEDCMKEITTHLESFLNDNSTSRHQGSGRTGWYCDTCGRSCTISIGWHHGSAR